MSLTLDKTGSLLVHYLICSEVTGREFNMSDSNMVSPGTGTLAGVSGSGNRLSMSALPCSFPGLY